MTNKNENNPEVAPPIEKIEAAERMEAAKRLERSDRDTARLWFDSWEKEKEKMSTREWVKFADDVDKGEEEACKGFGDRERRIVEKRVEEIPSDYSNFFERAAKVSERNPDFEQITRVTSETLEKWHKQKIADHLRLEGKPLPVRALSAYKLEQELERGRKGARERFVEQEDFIVTPRRLGSFMELLGVKGATKALVNKMEFEKRKDPFLEGANLMQRALGKEKTKEYFDKTFKGTKYEEDLEEIKKYW